MSRANRLDEDDLNMRTLAPEQLRKTKAERVLAGRDWNKGEVSVKVGIKELKFSNRKVSGAEIIAKHRGERVTVAVPFKKQLEFRFARVEDEMVFKFAVTSHGDLLGFIYLEIPQKFRTMKEFRLDDWFPVKQVEVDEEEVIKMQNFVARIIINYKASRKLELQELFTGKIPREKMYKALAKNVRERIGDITRDVEAFEEEGFKYLEDLERKLLEKRAEFNSKKSKLVKKKKARKPPKKGEQMATQKEVFYKGSQDPSRGKVSLNVTSKVAEVFHKDSGKDVVVKGGDLERQAEELLRELTKTKKDLVEKNQRIRGLREGKKKVDNDLLSRTLRRMMDDLARDKKELGIRLKEQTKALDLEREKVEATHENDMAQCGEMQNELKDVINEYKEKFRQLEALSEGMEETAAKNLENREKLKEREKELEEEKEAQIQERKDMDDLEIELDELKERMLVERGKIYKEGQKFSYDQGDISNKDKFLSMQEEKLDHERRELEKERDEVYAKIEERKKELEELKAGASDGSGNFKQMKEDYDREIKELMDKAKEVNLEKLRLQREEADLARERKDYERLKNVADTEKEQDQKTLEADYDYIDQQMAEIDNKRKELEDLQHNLEEYEAVIKERENSYKMENARFNKNRELFFDKIEKSEFNPDELKKIAKQQGHDLAVSKKAALLQEKREAELNRKLNKMRATIVKTTKGNNDAKLENKMKSMNQRRSTMVNRLSVTGQNLNALRMEQTFESKQFISKFLDDMFEEACAQRNRKAREEKVQKLKEMEQKIEELTKTLEETEAKLQQSKLDYFLKAPKKKITVKKRVSIKPKGPKALQAKEKTDVKQDTEVVTRTIVRKDSEGNEIEETITETIVTTTTTKEIEEVEEQPETTEVVEEIVEEEEEEIEESKKEESAPALIEENEEEEEEIWTEVEEEIEVEEDFDPERLPKNLVVMRDDLFKLCDSTIEKLERALPNIEKKNKVEEKVALLDGGKNAVANIFKVVHILNNNPEALDNALLKEMEEENADFDFESVRLQYLEKIRALVLYIKRIRSNYNFFNQGIDRRILVD